MDVTVISGSRADWGLLEWPIKKMQEDPFFKVDVLKLWGETSWGATETVKDLCSYQRPHLIMLLGDRFEIMGAAFSAHLARVPIAHIAGGDVTEGSYDDAMRDCISRMASVHFVTSTSAMARLSHMGLRNVHLVGSPGIDYIRKSGWQRGPLFDKPYTVVSYQAETIDGTNDIEEVIQSVQGCPVHYILPNKDKGSDDIKDAILANKRPSDFVHEFLPHDKFLNLILNCNEFVGNSSAMLYEAPELQIKTRMIGKRQRGRTIPMGDGLASERIIHVLKYGAL
jgi:UDP-hydrolysing UDP-N-acetyl-D-glucosamine 2-epimerase